MKVIRIFLLLILVSRITTTVHAQGEEPPIPAAPATGKYVLDELDWLLGKDEARINTIIRQLDTDGLAEIALVTLNDCGSDKTAFRKELFDTWGIGHQDDNDGLLILVCWYDGDPDRRSVEQLYGPGLNKILSSEKTDQIAQSDFVPAFRRGKPGEGLMFMLESYDKLLRESRSPGALLGNFWQSIPDWLQAALVFIFLFGGVFLADKYFPNLFRSDRQRWPTERDPNNDRDGFGGDGFDGGGSDGGGGSSTRF